MGKVALKHGCIPIFCASASLGCVIPAPANTLFCCQQLPLLEKECWCRREELVCG